MTNLIFVTGFGDWGIESLASRLREISSQVVLDEGVCCLAGGTLRRFGSLIPVSVVLNYSAERARFAREAMGAEGWLVALMESQIGPRVSFLEEQPSGSTVWDMSQMHARFLPFLVRRFPSARFVHLVQDGRSCVDQLMRAGEMYPDRSELFRRRCSSALRRHLSGQADTEGVPELLSELLLMINLKWPFKNASRLAAIAKRAEVARHLRHPRPVVGDAFSKGWTVATRFEKICWAWAEVNRGIAEALSAVDASRHLLLRCEDLDRPVAMDSLVRFANLPLTPRLNVEPPPVISRWSKVQLDAFERIAGSAMKRFGYCIKPS